MIQRIQSLYLLLATVLLGATLALPLAGFTMEQGQLTLTGLGTTLSGAVTGDVGSYPFGIPLLLILIMVLNVWCIFSYKNRKTQLRQSGWAVLLTIAFYIAVLGYAVSYAGVLGVTPVPQVGLIAPLLSLMLVLLARGGIRKDEALVRAADRIR